MCNLMSRQSKPPLKKKGVEPLAAAVDPPTIIEPNKFDVLCGKSRECVSFEGTRRFRQLIEQYRVIYQDAKNKQERMEITKEIVSSVGQTGRFLKFNRRLQAWEDIGTLAARDKVSHALRCAMQRHNKHREAKGNLKRSASPTSDASQSSIGSEVSSTGSEADMTDSDTKLKEHIGDQQSILSWFSVENFQSEEVDLPTAASLVTILEDSGSKAASPSGDTTENKPRYPIIGNHSVTGASHSELDAKSLHHSPTTMDPSVLPSHGNNNNLDSLLSVLDIDSEQSEPSFFAFTSHTPVPSSLPWDSSLLQTNNSVGGHDRPDHPHPPLRRDPASDGSPDSSGKQ